MQFLIYKQILQSQICINDCDFSTRIFPEWIVTALRTVKITESFKKNWYKGEKKMKMALETMVRRNLAIIDPALKQ